MIKYAVIYKHKYNYPVQTMCKFFEVSKSGYYDFVKRMDKPNRDAALVTAIAQCQEACRKTYGYRRVHIWLNKTKQWNCDPKTVLRVMRKYGLLSEIRRRRKYKNMGRQLHVYANHLNRNFYANKPNQKWVTDISYIHTTQGVLYLCIIRDLFDNSIVAYRTGTEQTVNLVLNTIKDANKKTAATEVQLHSDQGFQYTSQGYFNLTKKYRITPSMSRKGNCLDNAMAENFFSIIKTECINRQKIKSFDEAQQRIDDYIWFYNFQRVQLKTKLTPMELRRQFI
ncbi:MAG: IS3 family transposase [Defluviitaleaceae bacterium]|nr:IS3 family transposase [Defluviitaleaceae bacterium]